ncbi:MAG TPA: MerR family transcriptional regulator [Pseudonocardia sp.]|nr:MerR family transcriptional regulator [Pseudonocardia sp.]
MPTEPIHSITEVAKAFDVPVSTLRYYDDIGLVTASHRRSRVRHYDQRALERLVHVQLFRLDGLLSIDHTAELIASTNREQRNKLLSDSRAELADRIQRLRQAHDMLAHMMKCPHDSTGDCEVISTFLSTRVNAALDAAGGAPREAREAASETLQRLAESLAGPLHDQQLPSGGGQDGPPELPQEASDLR